MLASKRLHFGFWQARTFLSRNCTCPAARATNSDSLLAGSAVRFSAAAAQLVQCTGSAAPGASLCACVQCHRSLSSQPLSKGSIATARIGSSASSVRTSTATAGRGRGSTSRLQAAAHTTSQLVEAGAPTLGKVWPGLDAWRHSDVDHRRHWGTKGPEQEAASSSNLAGVLSLQGDCLAAHARQVLLTPDPRHKAWLSHEAWKAYKAGQVPIGIAAAPTEPARPARPELVPAKQIPTPKNSPLPLNVYMLHNLAHVELNAIDLAWDTVARFSPLGLEPGFYADFAHVADDESRHLGWCLQRLEELGHAYGDMPAHNLLWEGAQVSSGDLNGRLAVVPMSQEARGLDAGPRLSAKLVGWGDNRTAAIVERIAREEKAHVAVGVAWFRRICSALEADPGTSFRVLLSELCPNLLKGPFNHETRVEVGLEQSWYDPSMWPANTPAALTQPGQGALAGAPGSPDSLSRDDVRCASTEARWLGSEEERKTADPTPLMHVNFEALHAVRDRMEGLLALEAQAAA